MFPIFFLQLLAALIPIAMSDSQTPVQEFEKQITLRCNRIAEFRDSGSSDTSCPLCDLNTELQTYLERTLPKLPALMKPGYSTQSCLRTTLSSDGMIREWWWDNLTGGSWPNHTNIFAYVTPSGIKAQCIDDTTQEGGNNGTWVDTIWTVRTQAGGKLYLARVGSQYSNSDFGEGIRAFRIAGNQLISDLPIFKTPKKTVRTIEINYNYFTNYDVKTNKERNRITIVENGRTLLIPLVRGDSVTSSRLRYAFNGKEYVYNGVLK